MKQTDWLAIYAAVLSTIVFVWNVLRSRPRLKVVMVTGDEELVFGAYIAVQNRSSHVVHLANISLMYRDHHPTLGEWLRHAWQFKHIPHHLGWVYSSLSNYQLSGGCPLALAAYDSHHVFVPDHVVRAIISKAGSRELMAVAQDKIWKNSYSNAFTYPQLQAGP